MKCLCRWNAKNTKKNLNFCLFAEGNDQGPRQRRVLCRRPSHCPRQRFIGKILEHFFVEGYGWRPSAKTFLKKLKFPCRGPGGKPSAKIFQKKKNNSLPRAVPLPSAKIFLEKFCNISLPRAMVRGPRQRFFKKKNNSLPRAPALGKDSVPGAGAVTTAFLCRVPLQPSAKALPSAR